MTTQAALRTQTLPDGFTYLEDIDPTILQDVRYAGFHNFVGRPIPSYNAPVIILTKAVATKLKIVQEELKLFHLTLKVYDGYRPQDAVDSFAKWAEDPMDQLMRAEFYPTINKKDVFKEGYIAKQSSHTRGSAVD